MSYFFSTPLDIDIILDDADERTMIDMKMEKNRREKAPLYMDGESVKGAVTIRPKDGKRLEHTGIKVQFIGTIGTIAPPQSSLTMYMQIVQEAFLSGLHLLTRYSQRCFSIAVIITNFCRLAKNSRLQVTYSIHKPSNSTLRT